MYSKMPMPCILHHIIHAIIVHRPALQTQCSIHYLLSSLQASLLLPAEAARLVQLQPVVFVQWWMGHLGGRSQSSTYIVVGETLMIIQAAEKQAICFAGGSLTLAHMLMHSLLSFSEQAPVRWKQLFLARLMLQKQQVGPVIRSAG